MPNIHILPNEVINKIAAGEVVERPSSIVKELLENGLDAQAKYINIEIEDAGKKLIRVTDDGKGMDKKDVELSVIRHATSKLSDFSDLFKLQTLGFRGEALASVSSVSNFSISSKDADSPAGWEIEIEGGKTVNSKETSHARGTTVTVKDLFFNVPARRKFLKSANSEQSHIIRTLEETALAHPGTGFSVKNDGKNLFTAPPSKNYDGRIIDILGNKIYSNLLKTQTEHHFIKLTIFVSKLDATNSNKNLQYYFVNSRPITSKLISQSLYDAFKDSLSIGRHPIALIYLEINPQHLDVNVHPTKKLVKFSNETDIYESLRHAIKECLTRQEAPGFSFNQQNISKQNSNSIFPKQFSQQAVFSYKDNALETLNQRQSASAETNLADANLIDYKTETQKTFLSEYHILGVLHDTYVLIETAEGLLVMDQHAANERVLYEKFLNQSLNPDNIPVQKLLIPFTFQAAPHELSILMKNLPEINALGFELSEFGKNTLVFKTMPAVFGNMEQFKDFLREFISVLIDGFADKDNLTLKPREKIIRASCRAAVKARDKISVSEIEALIRDLNNCTLPLCCPHGRPTIINITINELQKKFRRI
ncbi:MAG: hypothetical protein A2252_02535 [Elusimicrobia bacterium RIFOXYA2_FULL_39_19]|nr:MAG: hypothetical protein A2252_02535 [Elusimicrobia bacterium RIFOXYA2_FULL_39_19]